MRQKLIQQQVANMGCSHSTSSKATLKLQGLASNSTPVCLGLKSKRSITFDPNNNLMTNTGTQTPNSGGNQLRVRQFDINDLDRQSPDSVKSGDSFMFPDHEDVEVLTCTPIKNKNFVEIEDTFWLKKRKLIPDYSVMEKIDNHVLTVGLCLFSRRLQTCKRKKIQHWIVDTQIAPCSQRGYLVYRLPNLCAATRRSWCSF